MEGEVDLANTLREERKTAELQALDGSFYQQVGVYLASLEQELSKIEDHYCVEATGKKDISQEYEIVRLLDSVPLFVGVDGRNYLLSKDDVVALPEVHSRNLRKKNLAVQVKIER